MTTAFKEIGYVNKCQLAHVIGASDRAQLFWDRTESGVKFLKKVVYEL